MRGPGEGDHDEARPLREAGLSQRLELALLALVVAVGAVARFGSLGLQSFWFDEATTGYVVALPGLGDVLERVADSESTPPLYYVLTWGFAKIAGQGDIALRAVSAIAGTAVIPVAWACARRLADARAGLIAAALVAFSPLLINYSQEARAYELLTLLCAVSFLLVLIAAEQRRPVALVGWIAVCAAAMATHYFAAFLVVPEAVFLLWVTAPLHVSQAHARIVLAYAPRS